MTYPMKDKTEAKKIHDSFQNVLNDIQTNQKTYEQEIEKLRKKSIPQILKDKLSDNRFGKSHAFEEMKHSHTENSRLDMINCLRCQFNEREIECENLIDGLNGNEKTVVTSPIGTASDKILTQLKIQRGRFDDVIGFAWGWS